MRIPLLLLLGILAHDANEIVISPSTSHVQFSEVMLLSGVSPIKVRVHDYARARKQRRRAPKSEATRTSSDESPPQEPIEDALSDKAKRLKAIVEAVLQREGIKIAKEDEHRCTNLNFHTVLRPNQVKGEAAFWAVNVLVFAKDPDLFGDDVGGGPVEGSVLISSNLGLASPDNLDDMIREMVDSSAHTFAIGWNRRFGKTSVTPTTNDPTASPRRPGP